MTDSARASRRGLLGAVATGVAAAATPALAQGGPAPGPVNPATRHPKPPFKAQQQPWPGLAGRMDPRPDHGETSYRGSGRLAGRRALITGGDSGMGRAAAIAFAREGADVAINYLPAEQPDAREVVALIREAGLKAVAIPGDLREEAFCRQLVERAARELGGLDIVVNNAARQQARARFADISSEDFDATLKTNLYPTFWITKAALPHLKPGSAIINTTSVVAYDPPPEIIDYAMTKAAIMNLAKSLAKQLAPQGIRVNGVAPGPIWTPLQPSGGQLPDKLPQFGADTRSAARASPPSWRRSTSCWPPTTPATPPGPSTARPAPTADRERRIWSLIAPRIFCTEALEGGFPVSNSSLAGRLRGPGQGAQGSWRSWFNLLWFEEMDMRAAYDFSPLYRSLIGADHMAVLVENARQAAGGRDYPPYDIEKTAEDGYRISLAVAGFRPDELEVTAQPNLLVVRGRKAEPQPEGNFLHQGLALRPFEQHFELADHVVVADAAYADGLLTIDLRREPPEALKPRRIEIQSDRPSPLKTLFERKRQAA